MSRHGVMALGLVIALIGWSGLQLLPGQLLRSVEDRAGDLVWRVAAERSDERRLIIVDIDEQSLKEIGPWPWNRSTQARLMDQLAAAGVREQVHDIVFTDVPDGKDLFNQALRRHKPVAGQIFALDGDARPLTGRPTGALDWSNCPGPFPVATGYIAPSATLALEFAGHITPRVTADGMIRYLPAIVCFNDKAYPALGIAAMMKAVGESGLLLQRGGALTGPAWWLTSKSQNMAPIPLDGRGDIRIPWTVHPKAFIRLSAADVLAGRAPDGLLKDAWVLVGSSAFGLHDTIATPFDGTAAGLQVHAQILAALIDDRIPYTPRGAPLYVLATAIAGIGLMVWLLGNPRRFPVYLLPVAAGAWGLALWVVHSFLQVRTGLWLGWVDSAVFVGLGGTAMGMLEHARNRIERDRLYAHLSSYLPAPVAAALALQPPSSAIRASTRMVTVLFADIRNFSAYCEARPPEESAAVLHAFFTTAAHVIEAHGGVIESFQGDAVIAVWYSEASSERAPGLEDASELSGADRAGVESSFGHAKDRSKPSTLHGSLPRHSSSRSSAKQALNAAIDLQKSILGVLPDPAPAGLEPLALGIGIEAGPAMSGSFGLASRRTHMVMGRTVTIASRLVEMTADLGQPILVGEGLAGQVGGVGLESMGTYLLDGLRVPHHVYAPPLDYFANMA